MANITHKKNINDLMEAFLKNYMVDGETDGAEVIAGLRQAWNSDEQQNKLKAALRKKKKPKTPRPKTAYQFFCTDERTRITDMSPKDVMIELGKRWTILKGEADSSELEKFRAMAAKAKAEFNSELDTDDESENSEGPKPKKPKKKQTRAKTAYQFFCTDQRTKITDMSPKEVMIELGKQWTILKEAADSSELEKFQELAAADKVRIDKLKTNQPQIDEIFSEASDPEADTTPKTKKKKTEKKTEKKTKKTKKTKKKTEKKDKEETSSDEISESDVTSGAEGFPVWEDWMQRSYYEGQVKAWRASNPELADKMIVETDAPTPKKKVRRKQGFPLWRRKNKRDLMQKHPEWKTLKATVITSNLKEIYTQLSEQEQTEWEEQANAE